MTEPLYVSGAAGYDELFAHVTRTFIPALLEAAQIAAGHRVLDVATGTGALAHAVAELVGTNGEVIAGDISVTMLDVAKRNLKDAAIDLRNLTDTRCHFRKVISTGSSASWGWRSSMIRLVASPNSTAYCCPAGEQRSLSTPRRSVLCLRGSALSSANTYLRRPSSSIVTPQSGPPSDLTHCCMVPASPRSSFAAN